MNEIMLSAAAAMMKPTAEASIVLPNPNGLGSFFVVGVVSIVFMCFFVTEKICKSTNYFPIEIFFGTNSSDTLCECVNSLILEFVNRFTHSHNNTLTQSSNIYTLYFVFFLYFCTRNFLPRCLSEYL